MSWHRSETKSVMDCGCRYVKEIEEGTRDYHERWIPTSVCSEHLAAGQMIEPLAQNPRRCPDDGRCWHDCSEGQPCFRVETCSPLSGVFPNDEWPEGVDGGS